MQANRTIPLLATAMLFSSLMTACGDADYRPEAVGQEAEIVIVMDSSRWTGELGETLRNTLGEYIETLPAPEPEFELRHLDIGTRFDEIKRYKNIVFAAPLSDTTATARFLRDGVDDVAAEVGAPDDERVVRVSERADFVELGRIAVHREDLWRRKQMVVYFTAATPEALAHTIVTEGEEVLYLFNRITRERVSQDIFDRGRQQDLEERLMEKHSFAVNVQHDFKIAVDTTNFIWMRRVLADSWRSIFAYYIENADPSVMSPEWIYATRDSLTRQWLTGTAGGWVTIDRPPRRPLETETVNFLDRYGFETRGLWQMVGRGEEGNIVQHGAGGPFVNYTFYDQRSGRIYMLDGMVFAPGYEKREFLRHMEAILHTFRAEWEIEEPATAAAHRSRTAPTAEAGDVAALTAIE